MERGAFRHPEAARSAARARRWAGPARSASGSAAWGRPTLLFLSVTHNGRHDAGFLRKAAARRLTRGAPARPCAGRSLILADVFGDRKTDAGKQRVILLRIEACVVERFAVIRAHGDA